MKCSWANRYPLVCGHRWPRQHETGPDKAAPQVARTVTRLGRAGANLKARAQTNATALSYR